MTAISPAVSLETNTRFGIAALVAVGCENAATLCPSASTQTVLSTVGGVAPGPRCELWMIVTELPRTAPPECAGLLQLIRSSPGVVVPAALSPSFIDPNDFSIGRIAIEMDGPGAGRQIDFVDRCRRCQEDRSSRLDWLRPKIDEYPFPHENCMSPNATLPKIAGCNRPQRVDDGVARVASRGNGWTASDRLYCLQTPAGPAAPRCRRW